MHQIRKILIATNYLNLKDEQLLKEKKGLFFFFALGIFLLSKLPGKAAMCDQCEDTQVGHRDTDD